MRHPLLDRVGHLGRELGNDPLFRASGAAMELFHSNVLAWLLRTHPEAADPLVTALGFEVDTAYVVHRERHQLDLEVHRVSGGRFLVCENKVTAIPDQDQLHRYRLAIQEKRPKEFPNADFVLLSLVPPSFDSGPWRHVSYRQVADATLASATELPAGFDADFLAAYGRLCGRLARLADAAGIVGREDEPYYLAKSDDAELRTIGLRDLVVKVRNAQLMAAVRDSSAAPALRWEAGWSRGEPLAAYFATPGPRGDRYHGWQLQGRQLRVAIVLTAKGLVGTGPGLRAAREEAAGDSWSWLDPEQLIDLNPKIVQTSSGSLPFNHYAPDFVYKYAKVSEGANSAELVSLLGRLTRRASTQ